MIRYCVTCNNTPVIKTLSVSMALRYIMFREQTSLLIDGTDINNSSIWSRYDDVYNRVPLVVPLYTGQVYVINRGFYECRGRMRYCQYDATRCAVTKVVTLAGLLWHVNKTALCLAKINGIPDDLIYDIQAPLLLGDRYAVARILNDALTQAIKLWGPDSKQAYSVRDLIDFMPNSACAK